MSETQNAHLMNTSCVGDGAAGRSAQVIESHTGRTAAKWIFYSATQIQLGCKEMGYVQANVCAGARRVWSEIRVARLFLRL